MSTKHPNESRRRGRTGGRASALLAAAVAVLPLGSVLAQESGAVDTARAALEKWVETRRLISLEKRDWALGRELLTDRVALLDQEIAERRRKTGDAEASIAEADQVRAGLIEENESLKTRSGTLRDQVVALETRTKALLARLPNPIRERVKPLSQGIPEDSSDTTLGLSDRYAKLVGILNEINKFNREITVTSEVHARPDGTSVEVTAVYVGIARGFYASASGAEAGVGTAMEKGWAWTAADEAAPAIAEVIAILQNERPAGFVGLPIQID